MNALHLLSVLHEEFPLSTMGPDFKGTHTLALQEDGLYANIWWNGTSWYARISGEALMAEPRPLVANLKVRLAALHAAGPPPPAATAAPSSPSDPSGLSGS